MGKGVAMLLVLGIFGCQSYQSRLKSVSVDKRTLFQRKTQVAFREAADALSDSNHRGISGPALGFALQDIVDQTCANQAGGAVVTIRSSQSNSFQMDSQQKNFKKDVFVNAEVVRSYSLADDDLECDRKRPIIEVDLDRDLVNLKLEVKHRREEKTFLLEQIKPSSSPATDGEIAATAPVSTREMSAIVSLVEGTRNVTFTAALGEVDDDISYSKESVGTGLRTESLETSSGQDTELHFKIQSQFKMVDTYYEHDHDRAVGLGPIRKEISQGTVKSTLAGQGYVETIFTALKLEFAQGVCKATSGKIQSRYFSEGSTTPHKTVDFDLASNSISVSDNLDQDGSSPEMDQADILSSMDIQKEICGPEAFQD